MRLHNKLIGGTAIFVLLSGGANAAYASVQSVTTEKTISTSVEQVEQSKSISSKATVANIVDITNLRKGPGLNFEIVAKAKAGESYPIVGFKGEWYQLSLKSGGTAYVANWVVKTDVIDSSQPVSNGEQKPDIIEENIDNQVKKTIVNIVDNTNLRKGPGLEYEIVAKVKAGEWFPLVESSGDWYQVSLQGGGIAYVAKWVVETSVISEGDSKVYIYHTHNRESWKNVARDTKGTSFDDREWNITLVGKQLAQQLYKKGIPSFVEETDFASKLSEQKLGYSQSYAESRKAVNKAIQSNPSLSYFFDIHRDADIPRDKTTVTVDGKTYARIMFVIGDGNPAYKENKKLAEALHAMLNKKYPGISRGVLLKSSHQGNGEYNQSVSNGSLLLEFGGINNTLQENLQSAEAFADVFAEYYKSIK
ncbi:stage II sporulation protein P [Paenibacillus eucommiae]|uniref:Stage II sporulation protein P n=1 Tax=Paenibacillus eucommiae TaxID=1355755 RepID=A0ABS4J6D3_9BACL|nr:stage II sporulation protein P [Paenibacillus eucommiae]MBP1995407.1 stage II sporulation protein P [Paenibacillus eucommiae]